MLILLTIFLFLFFPLVMLILRLIWPKINLQGFLAILTALAAWILVFLSQADTPRLIPLLQWQPASLFLLSPSLLVDKTSWYYALGLATLALSVVITSLAQLGQSPSPAKADSRPQTSAGAEKYSIDESNLEGNTRVAEQPITGWIVWASILAFTSLGLLAVTAGNLLTTLLAWTSLDVIELVILLGQTQQSRIRERIIWVFSAKMTGLCLALIACIMLWSHGSLLVFESITPVVSTLLVIAAGVRLGVLPLHLSFTRGLPTNRNLGTVLELIPATANYILLVRVSSIGVSAVIAPYLLGFAIIAGLYAAINWLRVRGALEGRPYWLVGTASLVVAAAILRQPVACLAWGIASLLSGGLIYSMYLRHKNFLPIIFFGLLNFSALPFSPTWQGILVYQYSSSLGLGLTSFAAFSLCFLLIQAILFAGYIRHALFGIFSTTEISLILTERWVWFLYPIGLIFIVITHFLIGWFLYPNLSGAAITGWIIGPVSLLISVFAVYFIWRFPNVIHPTLDQNLRSAWDRLLSFEWFYRFIWRSFRTFLKVFSLVSRILEGDGGFLWALVLFGLIFVFMQR
jgi:hypothetical protein